MALLRDDLRPEGPPFIYEGAGDPDPTIGIVEAHKSSAPA